MSSSQHQRASVVQSPLRAVESSFTPPAPPRPHRRDPLPPKITRPVVSRAQGQAPPSHDKMDPLVPGRPRPHLQLADHPSSGHRPTRDLPALAPHRIPSLLALEAGTTAREARPSSYPRQPPIPHPRNARSRSLAAPVGQALACAELQLRSAGPPNSRKCSETPTRHRRFAPHHSQIHRPAQPQFKRIALEHLRPQSLEGRHCLRFLPVGHRNLSRPLRVRRHGGRFAPHLTLRRD